MSTFIADLVLQVLSFAVQAARENIRQRQVEGIAAARARGVHLGRAARPVPEDFAELVKVLDEGKMKVEDAVRKSGLGRTTFYRCFREYRHLNSGEAKRS